MTIPSLLTLIRNGLEGKAEDEINALSAKLDIDFEEHFAYQTLQSTAFAGGRVPLESANWLYVTLGQTHTHFNSRPIEEKLLAVQMLATILESR